MSSTFSAEVYLASSDLHNAHLALAGVQFQSGLCFVNTLALTQGLQWATSISFVIHGTNQTAHLEHRCLNLVFLCQVRGRLWWWPGAGGFALPSSRSQQLSWPFRMTSPEGRIKKFSVVNMARPAYAETACQPTVSTCRNAHSRQLTLGHHVLQSWTYAVHSSCSRNGSTKSQTLKQEEGLLNGNKFVRRGIFFCSF